MTYYVQLFRFIFNPKEHILRIREAESVVNQWKISIFLMLASVIIYGWMGYLGIGSGLISMDATLLNIEQYEQSKMWFMIGRAVYGLLFAAFILFVPSLLFYYLTEIPYIKLVVMQQIVLVVLLLERLIWVPLVLFAGLDWYTSVLSFGVIVSYITEIDWLIYFFGAITIFQIGLIGFVHRYLRALSHVRSSVLLLVVILLFAIGWILAAVIATTDYNMISGWFE